MVGEQRHPGVFSDMHMHDTAHVPNAICGIVASSAAHMHEKARAYACRSPCAQRNLSHRAFHGNANAIESHACNVSWCITASSAMHRH
eukprot:356930-Chlamydomonas_euryale.AAC.12